MAIRSLLFVPADSERKIAKAMTSGADALILDLEDSVAPDRKPEARALCLATLLAHQGSPWLFVRINALETPDALHDLASVVRGHPYGIMLPKCRGADDVTRLGNLLTALEARDDLPVGDTKILPIVTETAEAMLRCASYAGTTLPRVFGMLWGGEDLAADVGAVTNRDPSGGYAPPYRLARSLCLLAATAVGAEPVDAVFTDFRDQAGLAEEAREAARSGFVAKAAIHPDQVPTINAAFTPSPEEIDYAQRVLDAFTRGGGGVAALDGKMLDRPHQRAALRILARRPG
jgi:citrate lyase subunit beta/citryl-CoA lyase